MTCRFFFRVPVLVAVLAAAPQVAQAWEFPEPDGETGRAAIGLPGLEMAFSCTAKGAEGHDPAAFTWSIGGETFLAGVSAAEGEVVRIALGLDGAALGEGPFLRQGADRLATSVPRALPALDRIRQGETLTATLPGAETGTDVPLAGLDAALDALIAWCDADPVEDTTTEGPALAEAQCDAPGTDTQRAICDTPALLALENDLVAAYLARLGALDDPARTRFASDHANWLDFRDNCAASADCIEKATTARLAVLAPAEIERPAAAAATLEAATPAPAALAVPLTPLQPAELGAVLWAPNDVSIRFLIEAARAQPGILDLPQIQQAWLRLALQQSNPELAGRLDVARDHLSRSVAATPPGPFLIGRLEGNPLRAATYSNGVLASETAYSNNPQTQTLGTSTISLPGVGAAQVRAIAQFDPTRLNLTEPQAQFLKEREASLQLGVVTQIDGVEVVLRQGSINTIVARGQVRFAGLFERPAQGAANFDPSSLVAVFPPDISAPPEPGLTGTARVLGLSTHDGAIVDTSGGYSGGQNRGTLNDVLRLAALKKSAPDAPDDQLRAYAFLTLATRDERDAVVHPVNFGGYGGGGNSLPFAETVDEFERGELLERIDREIWPRVRARLPETPFEVIVPISVNLGEYDRNFGGFPMQANVGQLGIAAQGDYPAFRELPDLLPISVEKARELVAYLEGIYGPGYRALTLVARYRVEDVGAVDWTSRQAPSARITPLGLSLHAYREVGPGTSPFDQKLLDFDLAAYRGPERPVADPERVAFWDEVRGTEISTYDDLALAAIGVGEDPALVTRLAENSVPVRNANQFDRDRVLQETRAGLEDAEKPDLIHVGGSLTLGTYDTTSQSFPVERVSFQSQPGVLGLQAPRIEFVDPGVLSRVEADPDTGRMLVGEDQFRARPLDFRAWLIPELAVDDGRSTTLFVRPERIVLIAPGDDGTGYPPAHVEIRPEPAGIAPSSGAEVVDARPGEVAVGGPAEMTPPDSVPLDSDYVDLLMIRDMGEGLSEPTWARMMLDRRLREQTAQAIGYPLEWGRFFTDPSLELNPVQAQAMLERFKTWNKARAEALPDAVFVQTRGSGMIPGQSLCWVPSAPPAEGYSDQMPAPVVAALDEVNYLQHEILAQNFYRTRASGAQRVPVQYRTIVGTPALAATRTAAFDQASQFCANQRSGRVEAEPLAGAVHWPALVEVVGAFRAPVDPQMSVMYRDHGSPEIEITEDGLVRIRLEVMRTEVMGVTTTNGQQSMSMTPQAELSEASLPAAPEVIDVFEIAPGGDWSTAIAAAEARLPGARSLDNDGPPENFREVTQDTRLGPLIEFSPFRNGRVLVDPAKAEALAILREPERDPDTVLGVASYRRFSAAEVGTEALIGALLRKYGSSPDTADDGSLYGPRPGQSLVWGRGGGCLPDMRGQIQIDQNAIAQSPDFQSVMQMVQRFRAPQTQFQGANRMVYESCDPVVWAFVGEDAEGTVHMVVWSLDMRLLAEVAGKPDLVPKVDGEDGSQTLMEKAADIDL